MADIREYYHDFEHLQEDLEENLHKYPLFQEMIDELFEKDIKEIDELLAKNDEYYLKKAISKLEDVNDYIKNTSQKISKLYDEYDNLAQEWNDLDNIQVQGQALANMNDQLKKANELISHHNIDDIIEANKIMRSLLKEARRYQN